MIQHIFFLLGISIRIYMYVCIIRIFLSWLPFLSANPLGIFICGICDPYLNWFRGFKYSRIGMVDFSPVLAIGFLSLLYQICFSVSMSGIFSPGLLIKGILIVLWSFFSLIIGILIVIAVLRFILDFSEQYRFHPFVQGIDSFLNPMVIKIQKIFFGGKYSAYRKSVLILFFILIAVKFGIEILFRFLFLLLP